MTTVAQVKQVVQPLLQRHSDLALVGRYLILKPVTHFVRGVFIDRSIDPKSFMPSVSVCLTFDGSDSDGIGWGNRLNYFHFEALDPKLIDIKENVYGFANWGVDRPETVELMLLFIEAALRQLRDLITFEQLVAFASKNENNFHPFKIKYYARLLMAVAAGDFDAAVEIISQSAGLRRAMDAEHPSFCPALFARDRLELSRFLQTMEATTIRI